MTSPAGNLRYIRTDFTSLDLCRAAGPATYLVYAARGAGFNLSEDTEDQFLRHLDAYRELKVLL